MESALDVIPAELKRSGVNPKSGTILCKIVSQSPSETEGEQLYILRSAPSLG
jgi:hypothetical protein